MAQASQKQLDFIQSLLKERAVDLTDIGFEDWILEDEDKGGAIASGVIAILKKLPKVE